MLGWSMNLFRVRGILLSVHFSFFLLLTFVGYQGWLGDPEAQVTGGWPGLFWNVAVLLTFFTCVVLHELGHSFMAMHFGVGVRRILLMPIGGMAEFDNIPRQPGRELLITLAGPAVNFAIAGVLWIGFGSPRDWGLTQDPTSLAGFAHLLLTWNLLMGLFNLVPVFPMDGGRIFRALLATRLPYLRATLIAASVGKVLAAIAAVLALILYDAVLTAVLFVFIFVAGEMEYRAVRRREIEDAHWRVLLERYNDVPPPANEPPIITR